MAGSRDCRCARGEGAPRGVAEVATSRVLAPDDERLCDDERGSFARAMGARFGSSAFAAAVNEGVKADAAGLNEKRVGSSPSAGEGEAVEVAWVSLEQVVNCINNLQVP